MCSLFNFWDDYCIVAIKYFKDDLKENFQKEKCKSPGWRYSKSQKSKSGYPGNVVMKFRWKAVSRFSIMITR
jgi:hypothetical protein